MTPGGFEGNPGVWHGAQVAQHGGKIGGGGVGVVVVE